MDTGIVRSIVEALPTKERFILMETKVTLTIPENIYRRVEQVAISSQKPMAEIINNALAEAFPAVHVNPRRHLMEREQEAYQKMLPNLLEQYESQYIAVHNGEVIDHDSDKIKLVGRIQQSLPDAIVLIKKVTTDPDQVIHMRSPRLIN
jgi:hypothetical protein